MDRELLIEIGVEELPAAWLPGLTRQLQERVEARLADLRIAPGAPVESYATPRRLTARVARIAERQEDLDEEISGPPVSAAFGKDGQPTPAVVGFAKKHGVSVDALGRKQTPKGEYLVFRKHVRGRSAVDALPDLMTGVLRDLSFPKQMRWDAVLDDGRGELVFGRPIRWLLFLYGGRVVPFTIGRAANASSPQVQDVESGALTYGHRFLTTSGRAGRSIKVRSFDEYQARLKEHFVVLDHTERRERIVRALEMHARRLGGRVQMKEHAALIDEVADLVEYPSVVAGFFDRSFLALPQEVLVTTLVHHQHFFPVVTEHGELKEAFLAVVNTQPQDERLIAKNAERVVTARLRDAKFFWEADRKLPLDSRMDRLHTVVFHKQLGSYRDKAQRIEKLAGSIAAEAFGRPDAAPHASQAALLAKADLTSDMVFEFPELQGTMGGIYAREQGLPEPVWKAIYHHYLPIGVEADAPPSRDQLGSGALAWAATSLADKLDTVVGLMGAGEKVTGSRDPFGLRRAGQGVMKILVDLQPATGVEARPILAKLVARAKELHPAAQIDNSDFAKFWAERLRHLMQVRGLDYEQIQAVTGDVHVLERKNPVDLIELAETLGRVSSTATFAAVSEAFKRANNILDEAWGSKRDDTWGSLRHLLISPAEKQLAQAVDGLRERISEALVSRNPEKAVQAVAAVGPTLGRFFDEVRVNVSDETLREARLQLLADFRDLVQSNIGDISMLSRKHVSG